MQLLYIEFVKKAIERKVYIYIFMCGFLVVYEKKRCRQLKRARSRVCRGFRVYKRALKRARFGVSRGFRVKKKALKRACFGVCRFLDANYIYNHVSNLIVYMERVSHNDRLPVHLSSQLLFDVVRLQRH